MPDNFNNSNADDSLKTINEDGSAPKIRVGDGNDAYSIWTSLWQSDTVRSKRRTQVKGLVDGNLPYNPADLIAAGVAHRCNVNWGAAKAYLDNASGAFYDLFSESDTYAKVRINKPGISKDQIITYSEVVSKHFDWLMRYDRRFDYNIQVSQEQMTLFAVGPLCFPDEIDWMPRAILAENLKVQEREKSDTNYWELCTVEVDYRSDELWRKVVDEKAATAAGWNVSAVKQSIMRAHPSYWNGQLFQQWEWHQQQLKNGSIYYGQNSKVISVVHMFYQEFSKEGNQPGKITQVTFNQDQAAQKTAGAAFLYKKIGRYDDWTQCIHPMYYDRGGGGYHHSVTGLGVKMYPALTFMNRLQCANGDKAFAPKLGFKPSNATNADEFSLEVHGDYMILQDGFEPLQLPVQSYMEDGIEFHRYVSNELQSNLSQYKGSQMDEQGNPPTARQVSYEAANEARLQKTQMVRYYMQLDALYAEMYRRAVIMGKQKVGYQWQRCQEFIQRCEKDGVPRDCLEHTEFVKASRVIGQGSEFMRQQSLEFLWVQVLPMLNEEGRQNLLRDLVASRAGQFMVDRYAPTGESAEQQDQRAWAVSTVADMKVGVVPVTTSSQDPIIFIGTYLEAAQQSIASLRQGANPSEVVAFLEICGQSVAAQLDKLRQDPTRKQMVKQVDAQLKELGRITDEIAAGIQQQQQEQMEQQAALQQQASIEQQEMALKKQAQDFKLGLSAQKTQAQLRTKGLTAQQAMAIRDAEAAQRIRQSHQTHTIDTVQEMERHQQEKRNGSGE